jgi:hypothetical protein
VRDALAECRALRPRRVDVLRVEVASEAGEADDVGFGDRAPARAEPLSRREVVEGRRCRS